MSLDITKTINDITYNGNEFPISKGTAKTCTFTRTGPKDGYIRYFDPDGNIQIKKITNEVSFSMLMAPFEFWQASGLCYGNMSGAYYYSGDITDTNKRYNLSSTGHTWFPEYEIITAGTISCFLPDTLITLSDGSTKQAKDITYNDRLKVWDFDKGEFGESSICWISRPNQMNDHYYKLTFSDGTICKFTGDKSNHKIYDVDKRKFVGVAYMEIGDKTFSENGIVTITNKEYIEEECEYYNLITTGNINCFCNGILASDRYGNMYPIDEDMKYIKGDRPIRPYSEFESHHIKRYWYDNLRLGELTDDIDDVINYIGKLECQMLPLPE